MKRRAVMMIAALALAGGACGGDDDADVSDGAAESDVTSSDDGDDTGTNDWCTLMEQAETPAFDDLDITDPESVENAFAEVVDLIDEAVDSAPDEIEDDIKIVSDQFKAFFDQLEDADFDFTQIDQTELDNPEADAATARIDEFCGLDTDAGETVTTDDTATADTLDSDVGIVDDTLGTETDATDASGDDSGLDGTTRDEVIAQLIGVGLTEEQAKCIVDNVADLEDFAATGASDPTAFLALVETCEIDLTLLQPPAETGG